jgi:DNA-binding IclR family transcriptional regulator
MVDAMQPTPIRSRDPLSKAMQVLEYLAGKPSGEVGIRELARFLGVSPSAAQGLVALMRDAGFIERGEGESGGYVFSRRLLRAAREITTSASYAGLALESLTALSKASNETSVLAEYDRRSGRAIFTEMVESYHVVRVVPRLHEWMSIDRAASGLAILAFLPDPEQKRIVLEAKTDIERGSSPWHNETELRRALASIKRAGFAQTAGQRVQGAVGIFAPVHEAGKVVGAIGLDIPEQRFQRTLLPQLGKLVIAASEALGARLAKDGDRLTPAPPVAANR